MKPIHIIAGLGATAIVALAGWYMYMSQTPTYERTYERGLPPGEAAPAGEEAPAVQPAEAAPAEEAAEPAEAAPADEAAAPEEAADGAGAEPTGAGAPE